jgi:gliding motility-associated-like protein
VIVSADGCYAADNVQVFMTAMPTIDLGDDIQQVCEGSTITIYSGYVGEWSNGDMGTSTTTGNEGVLSFIYPNSGCPVGDSIFVDVVEYPVINLGADLEICPGASTIISTNGLEGTWNLGLNGTEVTVSNPATYVFTSSNWECESTDTVVVSWKDLPVLILPEIFIGCIDELVLINVENDVNSFYSWSNGSVESSITVAEPDVYTVTVGNDCGEIEGETEVFFEDCTPQIFVPNAFSPNDDGINDVWAPGMFGIVEYQVQVFNRWGFVVFESNDPTKVWTGNVNTSEYFTPDGVYSYRIAYLDVRNHRDILVGTVTLMR